MCGIFGFNGKKPPVLEKIKILGLYNQSRGKDSSGYYYNGVLEKDASINMGEWDDFIRHKVIEKSRAPYHTFIGHVRQGSVGYSKGVENAHPFIIDQKLILAHNGTLYNYKDLLTEYNIEEKFTVDSKALGALIVKVGFKPILEKYVGYAALLMCDVSEPESILVYHGQSMETYNGSKLEERPLFFMETNEGVYFSSLREGLEAIKEYEEEEPKTLIYNEVVKFRNGMYVEKDSIHIDRLEQNIDMWRVKNKNNVTTNNAYASNAGAYAGPAYNRYNNTTPIVPEYLREIRTVYNAEFGDRIYYHRLRYYTESPNELMTGTFKIKEGRVVDKEDDTATERLFIEGVLIKKEFEETIWEDTDIYEPANVNFAQIISKYSEYPVGNLEKEATTNKVSNYAKEKIYHDGKEIYAKQWSPLWSIRTYVTNYLGNVIRIDEKPTLLTKDLQVIKTIYTIPEYNHIKPLYTSDDYLFSNGMLVKKPISNLPDTSKSNTSVNKQGVLSFEENPIKVDKKLEALLAFCDRRWEDKEELDDKLPCTVINALHLYHAVYLGSGESYVVSTTDIMNETDSFIDEMILNKLSINEQLAPAYGTLEKYLKEAIKSEEEGTDLFQDYYVFDEEEDDDDDVEKDDDDVENKNLFTNEPNKLIKTDEEVKQIINETLKKQEEKDQAVIDKILDKERAQDIINRLIKKDFENILIKAETLVSLQSSDLAQEVAHSLFTLISGIQKTLISSKEINELDEESISLIKNLNKSIK